MAKSSKIEDYWRQNNIESLLKDITHTLAQRMPSDPAAAIVEHLQKKFPRSFRTSIDHNTSMGTLSKTTAGTLQLKPFFSPRSDANNDSINDADMQRRASNQSEASGIATVPTAGSAFTDLLKQNASSASQAPAINIKNLVFANRFSQQAVKLGRDIRSDRDILEEELIKPQEKKPHAAAETDIPASLIFGDPQQTQTHEEPSVKQLIKYKQQIHLENDRRLHRENLAALAKEARQKEQSSQPDLQTRPNEIQQEQQSDDGHTLSHTGAETGSTKAVHKPIAKSKEEEDILNDENIFHSQGQRHRERHRHKLSTSRSNSPYARKQSVGDLTSSMRRGHDRSMPIMQFGVCKVCGNMMNSEGDQLKRNTQQVSAVPTVRSFQHQSSPYSVTSSAENVDDWFESASEVSGPREMTPWKSDDITPSPDHTNPLRENVFQPINDNHSIPHRPPIAPLITTDDEIKMKRSTPRMSESDVFVRTPEPTSRRPSSSRGITSPVAKKHQSDSLFPTDHQSSRTTAHLSPSPSVPITGRGTSGGNVREHAPDDSDVN